MIKFFRQIRQRLKNEQKISQPDSPVSGALSLWRRSAGRYFLYAIGEIILVVIGILIALSVNNWNEARKDKIKEYTLLVQLEEDYVANLQQLDEKMQLRAKIIQSGHTFLKYIDTPEHVPLDSIIYHISNIIYDPTFDPIQNDLISSGNIRLIRNDRLRRLLSNWTSDKVAVQEQEKINQIHAHEIILPLFNKIGITRYALNELWKNMGDPFFLLDNNTDNLELNLGHSFNKISAEDITTNIELEGVASSAVSYNQLCNIQSQSLKNRINEILELIRMELNKKENKSLH